MTTQDIALQTRHYIVHGRVQGVGFRWFVEREAQALGLVGWVRNNADGTVEVLATGPLGQLSYLHEALRRGPRAARVDRVDVAPGQPVEGLKSFRTEGSW
jgi:acylphosphatase